MGIADYYEILGLTPSATPDEIRAAYRRLASKSHPDSGGSAALFRMVQEAHDTLSDPSRRDRYDAASGNADQRQVDEAEKQHAELERARREYVSHADAYNRAISAAWDAVPSRGPNWDDYPRLYAVSAEANRSFAQALCGYDWPSSVRDTANALVDAVAEEAGRFYQASALPGTKAALASVLEEIQDIGDRAADAAQAMRKALDLPSDA